MKKSKMTKEQKAFHMGKMICLSEMCIAIRDEGLNKAAHDFADNMLTIDENHMAALWIKEHVSQSNNLIV